MLKIDDLGRKLVCDAIGSNLDALLSDDIKVFNEAAIKVASTKTELLKSCYDTKSIIDGLTYAFSGILQKGNADVRDLFRKYYLTTEDPSLAHINVYCLLLSYVERILPKESEDGHA